MATENLPDNWASLPVMDAVAGGKQMRVKYDNEKQRLYLLDEKGGYTGKFLDANAAKSIDPDELNTPEQEKEKPPESQDEQEQPENGMEDENDEKPVKKKTRRRKQSNLLTGVLVAIIICLCGLLYIQSNKSSPEKQYTIIIAMDNIQPGMPIKGKLASFTIPASDYNLYGKEGLYLASEYESIENYVATTFIPKDGRITYSNIGESFQITNPWKPGTNSSYITIPVQAEIDDIDKYIWGNQITLTVVTTKVLSTDSFPNAVHPSTPDASCTSLLQSVQIDTYTISDATIFEVLNDQKKSLYSSYASMAAIPRIYQESSFSSRYSSEGYQVQSEIPAYIQIKVSKETVSWWETLNAGRYTVSVSINVTGSNCETSFQDETYQAIKTMLPTLKAAQHAAVSKED